MAADTLFGDPDIAHIIIFPPPHVSPPDSHHPHLPHAPHSTPDCDDPELESDSDAPLLDPSSSPLDPEPFISNQFYTFNSASHHLMIQCILQNRYANASEIKEAASPSVLHSWRVVWKDRNEDTAYLTGWKRIQDKLHAQVDAAGNERLFFKNSPRQSIPHVSQWHDIVSGFHSDADLQHLGVKDTIDRIKQVWTVGAKLYGIPEPYIKAYVASCRVCGSFDMGSQQKQSSKRHRFQYTESFEVQANEVPRHLQQLAAKHQVVLCIRQKYIRFKPFLAEVKDYCCHRAGEPNLKKPGVLKRKRYSSKRCGCGFRIRAIVPITNYSEKEKTFTYLEEGKAVFKLYAVHSGHEPGPHEGSARIIHRLVGSSSMQMDTISPFDEEEEQGLVAYGKGVGVQDIVMQQIQELCLELQTLDRKLVNISQEALNSLSQDLASMIHMLKNVDGLHGTTDLLLPKNDANGLILDHPELGHWADGQNQNKQEVVSEHLDSDFRSSLGSDNHWGSQSFDIAVAGGSDASKDDCSNYNADGISDGDQQVAVDDDGQVGLQMADVNLVTMPVDNYYQDNVRWYDGVSCGLDPNTDALSHSVQAGFRHSLD